MPTPGTPVKKRSSPIARDHGVIPKTDHGREPAFNQNLLESNQEEEGQLALDVYQTPNEIVIVAPIAGVKIPDLHLSITEDVLTIKGKRCLEFDIPEEDYLTQECYWGNFSRSIVLPASVDTSKISASFKDAVLKISIPRTERTKTKLIRIKAD
jgi:HSP20 family protein